MHSDLYYFLSGNGKTTKITLVERKKGMFRKIFNTSGSIYTLSSKNFAEGQTGWSAEVVSNYDEEVLKEEFIPNLYDELIKTVIILLKGEAVFPLRCVSICPLLQQINQP